MDKYTFADVIISPIDPRVEIGAEYIFGTSPTYLLERLNSGKAVFTKLKEVCPKSYEPFNPEMDSRSYPLCVPRKGSLYSERQRKWIADNGIKLKDRVRVTRKADPNEDSWPDRWTTDMDKTVGKTLYVWATSRGDGIYLKDNKGFFGMYPYFILEKVEPEYVPYDFDDPEVRKELMGKTIINNYGLDGDGEFREVMIVGFMNKSDEDSDCYSSNGDTEGTIAMTIDGYFHADELLNECTFLDGTPCGKLVEAEE